MSIYARRRLVALTIGVILILGLHTALVHIGRFVMDSPTFACSAGSVLVEEGDTMESIGETYCSGDTATVVRLLVEFYGADIRPKQRIDLPTAR